VGSLFSALKQDIIGALGRTGYLFLNCFLVLMLSAAVTIPANFRQRSTLFKHRSAEFYSGRVEYLTRVVLDIPLSVLEAILLASISYYWVDMNPDPNRFLFFMGVLIALEMVGQAIGRFLSAVIQTQVMANTMSSLLIFISAAVSGFMPSYMEIPPILRWLNWVTPVSWAFEAIMINEFQGRSMYAIVVIDEKGTANVGSVSGDDWLAMSQVPRVPWADPSSVKGFDLFMLFVWAIVYDLAAMYLLERSRDWYFNQIRQPYAVVRRREIIKPKTEEGVVAMDVDEDVHDEVDPDAWPKSLAVSDLTYTVPLKGGGGAKFSVDALLGPCLAKLAGKEVATAEKSKKEITLLNGVTARFRRGKMAALMGQSGAGKTTLMDVIAGYKTGGKITGDILIHGAPKNGNLWRRISGYAEQNDILNPYLSVLETLEFTAKCRLPPDTDHDDVMARVISLMHLEAYPTLSWDAKKMVRDCRNTRGSA
jgi:ABC-type multidrug transport system fused ATPase/permease subunit